MLICCPAIPKMWPLFCAIEDDFTRHQDEKREVEELPFKVLDSEVIPFTSIHISLTLGVT